MENKIKQPVKLILLTIVFAYMWSFLPEDQELFGIKLRHVDILKDLKPSAQNIEQDDQIYEEYEDYLKEYQEMMEEDSSDQSSNFKLGSSGRLASFNFLNTADLLSKGLVNSRKQVETKEQKITGNIHQLKTFFDALKKSKSQVVRIAHFGDSGIEGDLMTADFRERFQEKFGGMGVGWVSITKPDASFRMSTKMTASSNWESAALYSSNPKNYPLGISGEIYIPQSSAWVQYETTRYYPHTRNFKTVRLFYSHTDRTELRYSFDRSKAKTAKLKKSGERVKMVEFSAPKPARKLKVEFPGNSGYYYGLTLENGPGVYIDNFPLRGNSGVDLNQIPTAVLKDFSKYLDYKLIILEFGLNAIGMIKRNYKWYVREMVNVINHLKKAYPNASFLMIGVHDKSSRRNGKFMSDPAIYKLLKAQLEIVKEADIAYWNLFEAMGGKNSMHKWVKNNPPLASHDHLHFNLQGAKIVSKMLMKALMDVRKRVR
ncbi:MAG: hypothetical protein D6830_00425 [Ignavibacteria bacterium]|nr:MAG: hypothetical protein D6830_00425 [Ignavibacteria bacterium]